MFPDNQFKVKIINDLPEDKAVTVYRCAPLVDLCCGLHITNTSFVKTFICLKAFSVYWKGKQDRESLQRVYGISFLDKKQLKFATGNLGLCGGDATTCNYVITYGDGSYSRGDLRSEILLLEDMPVEKFVFSCGRNNKGFFETATGLMGLGRSDLSLISQTSDIFGGVFSYCLPTTDLVSSGSLILEGDESSY